MAAETEHSTKPVREQLKKATLEGRAPDEQDVSIMENEQPRPLSKKRSHEELEDGEPQTGIQHTRKRSRDSTAELEDGESARKRVSEEVNRDSIRPMTPEVDSTQQPADLASPKIKRSRITDDENKATASPKKVFGQTGQIVGKAEKKDLPQTSESAFASSGFSALSKSTSSGFGAIGKNNGGFGSGGFASNKIGADNTVADEKDGSSTKSVFGGSLGAKSAFSSPSNGSLNGFGSNLAKPMLGSAFGSGSGFASLNKGPGLTSFASGKSSLLSPGKATNAFGAPPEEGEDAEDAEDDDADANDGGTKSPPPVGTDEEKTDERFYKQSLETGEEDEEVLFTSRAKLYSYEEDDDKMVWKERGTGILKLNRKKTASQEASTTALARLIMRADGSQRVVLNSNITKELPLADPQGGPPQGRQLLFMGTAAAGGQLQKLQLKMREPAALELYEKVEELQSNAA